MIRNVGHPCVMKQATKWCSGHKKMHVRFHHLHVKTMRLLWFWRVTTKTILHHPGGLP